MVKIHIQILVVLIAFSATTFASKLQDQYAQNEGDMVIKIIKKIFFSLKNNPDF